MKRSFYSFGASLCGANCRFTATLTNIDLFAKKKVIVDLAPSRSGPFIGLRDHFVEPNVSLPPLLQTLILLLKKCRFTITTKWSFHYLAGSLWGRRGRNAAQRCETANGFGTLLGTTAKTKATPFHMQTISLNVVKAAVVALKRLYGR